MVSAKSGYCIISHAELSAVETKWRKQGLLLQRRMVLVSPH